MQESPNINISIQAIIDEIKKIKLLLLLVFIVFFCCDILLCNFNQKHL